MRSPPATHTWCRSLLPQAKAAVTELAGNLNASKQFVAMKQMMQKKSAEVRMVPARHCATESLRCISLLDSPQLVLLRRACSASG